MNASNKDRFKKVIIIGGGFAGINLAKKLSKNKSINITLVDQNNYNFFIPLIYQVATGFLEPSSISYPFRRLLRKNRVEFRLGSLLKIDDQNHKVYLDNGILEYDFVVLATGCETNYFNDKNMESKVIPMKTLSDSILMRNRLLSSLEQASITTNKRIRRRLLTTIIVGGGPTGVEVAGVLAELRRTVFLKDYPEIANSMGGIYLIHGGSALLAQMSKKSSKEAYLALTKLGVQVLLNSTVKQYDGELATLSTGDVIESSNVIWAAGIIARKFEGIPDNCIGRANRIIVNPYNEVSGLQDVYAIGDTCIQSGDPNFPEGHPQLAQVAIQQGKHLALNLSARSKNEDFVPFRYKDKGTMAIIGRKNAVTDLTLLSLHFGGFFALFIWLFIHINSLISYRNKLKTLYNWILAYITGDESLRMIIRPSKEL